MNAQCYIQMGVIQQIRWKSALIRFDIVFLPGSQCASELRPENRHPYLASIRQPGSRAHVCSGTLIDDLHILTAAHCVDPNSAYSAGRLPIAHIGATSVDEVDENVEVILVNRSIIHPAWDGTQRSAFNVAILQLSTKSRKEAPVVLFDHFRLRTGQELSALGFGAGGISIDVGSDIFGTAKVEAQEFIAQEHCNRTSLWNGTIPRGVCCGLNHQQRASCLVDSGSPLVLLDQPKHNVSMGLPIFDFVIGFNIDGAACGAPNKPDVYTNLTEVYHWIMQYSET